jgi:hypothetical protein
MTITTAKTDTGVLVSFTSQEKGLCVRATQFVPNAEIPDFVAELQSAYVPVRPVLAPYVPEVCDHCGRPVESDNIAEAEWLHSTSRRWSCDDGLHYAEVRGSDVVSRTPPHPSQLEPLVA